MVHFLIYTIYVILKTTDKDKMRHIIEILLTVFSGSKVIGRFKKFTERF